MNSSLYLRSHSKRGSAVIAALVLCIITAVVAASILTLGISEKRMNRSSVITLEARNTAESASEFVIAQVEKILQTSSDFTTTSFTGDEALSAPPEEYFDNATYHVDNVQVYAGMVADEDMQSLLYLDPASNEYRGTDYAGTYAFRRRIPIAATATVSASGQSSTAYVTQYLEAYIMPLFTFAAFYGGDRDDPTDLELFPGPQMTVWGPVHSNGDIFVRKQSSSGVNLTFLGRVSAAGGFYTKKANQPLLYMMRHGAVDTTDYTDHVYLTHPVSGTSTAVRSGGGVWRDYFWTSSTETETTRNAFRDWADTAYSTNLRTRVNGLAPLVVNGANGAAGRSFIAPPRSSDSEGAKSMQIARKAGLIIVVNPDDEARSVYIPNVGTRTMDAGSYRAYTRAGDEVILPGQLHYGPSGAGRKTNTLANAPVAASTASTSQPYANAVVRTGTGAFPTAADLNFYDLRRVTNGHRLSPTGTHPHTPRPIRKIDIDMTNLKKAVDRSVNGLSSSSVYVTTIPDSTTWTNSIFNPSGTPTSEALTDAHAIFYADSESPVSGATFWNGGIYILSVDAETRDADTVATPTRHDSGVRLINGRGRLASKSSQGLTVATNDVLYIFGHYNADGSITTGTSNSSGRFPESDAEAPCAIMADAIAVLSQPVFALSSGNYLQTRGWNDAFGQHRIDDYSNYSTNWSTTAPSTSNRIDGINTSVRPGRLPWWSQPHATLGSAQTSKFVPYSTEISAAFLTGIVRSNPTTGVYSGGLHNYPRLLEDWYTSNAGTANTLAIRGSMVAFFYSAVGTEPWSLRYYQAPIRLWGLHSMFVEGELPPLTPNTIALQQLNFRLENKEGFEAVANTISLLGAD